MLMKQIVFVLLAQRWLQYSTPLQELETKTKARPKNSK